MRERIYLLIFPAHRVRRWSYPIWNRLPYRLAGWLLEGPDR